MLKRCVAFAVSIGVVSATSTVKKNEVAHHFCRCDLNDRKKCTKITLYGLSSTARPRIDVSDTKTGIIETNVEYTRREAYQYYYYHIDLKNEQLKMALGPVDVDSISELGMLKSDVPAYLSPKMVEGRDTRFFMTSNCPEYKRPDTALPSHLNIHTDEPHLPKGPFCVALPERKVFIVVNFVSNKNGYYVEVYELNSRQVAQSVPLTIEFTGAAGWIVSLTVKDDNVIGAIGKDIIEEMKRLNYNSMIKPGRESLVNLKGNIRFRPRYCTGVVLQRK